MSKKNENLSNLERDLNLKFNNKNILQTAFTHRSYLNENKNYNCQSNERMEFLGDAVLQHITSKYLYDKFPNKPEGTLTSYRSATVNTKSLWETALKMGLGKYLLMSVGEEQTGGRERPYILANTFEALLGAIYLDLGLKTAKYFVHKHLFPKIPEIIKNKDYKDPKSYLQEIVQEKYFATPSYKILKEEGPDHEKTFTAGVYFSEKLVTKGKGNSKQRAEEDAARKALKLEGKD